MVKSNFHIRELTSADLDQYNALLRYAFQVTEKNLQDYGWEEDDIKQSKFPILERADVWAVSMTRHSCPNSRSIRSK